MVKTTYALTLFTAVSLAAPVQKADRNFIGAGTADGQVNDVVKGLFKNLTPREEVNADASTHGNLIDKLPIVGSLLGGSSGKQSRRSFTGDLANFPLLGEIFGGVSCDIMLRMKN